MSSTLVQLYLNQCYSWSLLIKEGYWVINLVENMPTLKSAYLHWPNTSFPELSYLGNKITRGLPDINGFYMKILLSFVSCEVTVYYKYKQVIQTKMFLYIGWYMHLPKVPCQWQTQFAVQVVQHCYLRNFSISLFILP